MLSWLLGALGIGGGRVITAVITFLGKLNLAQFGCLALGLLLIVQHFQLLDARHDRDSYKSQRDYYKTAIDKRAAESKAQQKQVGGKITRYITVEKPVVRTQVERVESAPLPGGCRTPQAVLDADL